MAGVCHFGLVDISWGLGSFLFFFFCLVHGGDGATSEPYGSGQCLGRPASFYWAISGGAGDLPRPAFWSCLFFREECLGVLNEGVCRFYSREGRFLLGSSPGRKK
ncbi:hypothetical protein QBC39DRAFT_361578 [Podospora conica]|nr:hypothetical protein QBC39DRAFT_361578 [Schizothecium conicum]